MDINRESIQRCNKERNKNLFYWPTISLLSALQKRVKCCVDRRRMNNRSRGNPKTCQSHRCLRLFKLDGGIIRARKVHLIKILLAGSHRRVLCGVHLRNLLTDQYESRLFSLLLQPIPVPASLRAQLIGHTRLCFWHAEAHRCCRHLLRPAHVIKIHMSELRKNGRGADRKLRNSWVAGAADSRRDDLEIRNAKMRIGMRRSIVRNKNFHRRVFPSERRRKVKARENINLRSNSEWITMQKGEQQMA